MFTPDELKTLRKYVAGINETLTEKIDDLLKWAEFKGTVYVDMPSPMGGGTFDWVHCETFGSMPEAAEFIRENIGHCDEWGHVALTTVGDPAKDDDTGEFEVPGFVP